MPNLWKTLSRGSGYGKCLIHHIPRQIQPKSIWHFYPVPPAILLIVKKSEKAHAQLL
jgi:hypothetical protein